MALRLILAFVVAFNVVTGVANAQELRGFWADGFSDGFKTPEQVDQLLARLRRANCNAIFAQVRKSGDAYYLSRYEPWASDNPQHFDALAYLIAKAHSGKPRIQVHAWINTCATGKSRGNPFHITELHPDWLSLSDTGESHDGEASKIDPGHPDAADWTFRVYLDVARHYDVDGIHFDFVRYGSTDGKGRWGYNPVSVARFNARYSRTGQSKWDDPLWMQWRRDQVTALVRKVYAMATAIKPKLIVSAATITWGDGPHDTKDAKTGKKIAKEQFWREKSAPMNRVFQDWHAWMKEGILDLNCQMSYYNEKKHPDYFRHWIDWGKDNQFGRFDVPAVGAWLNPIGDSLQQIDAIRKPSAKKNRARGVMFYSYGGTDAGSDGKERQSDKFFDAISQPSAYCKNPPFARWADPPAMPWKDDPKTGSIHGFVLTSDALNPVDGAKVALTGKVHRSQLTDATGFYAFVNVPEGEYKVKVEASGYATSMQDGFSTVESIEKRNTDFYLGSPFPAEYTISPPRQIPLGAPAVYNHLRVIAGTDLFPDSMIVGDMDDVGQARVRLTSKPVMPFQTGDEIALRGIWKLVDGEATIDNAIARWIHGDTDDASFETVGQRMRGSELAEDGTGIPLLVRVNGRVSETASDRFVLDDGTPSEVMLAGRKDPGVESPETPIPAPELGSYVEVTGYATVTKHKNGTTLIRLRPRGPEDISRALPAPASEQINTVVGLLALPVAAGMALLTVNRRRKANRAIHT